MSPYYKYFERMHAEAGEWIRLQELIQDARADCPKSSYLPSWRSSGSRPKSDAIEKAFHESFHPVSAEVCASFGDRFQDGSWPSGLSDVHSYWIGVILVMVEKTVWAIGPTPGDSLAPTIIPFPPHDFRDVALWFCTEWWAAKGTNLFISGIKQQNEDA